MILTLQLEDGVVKEFDSILPKLGIVNWDNVLKSADYVERWRCLLWAKAFHPLLRNVVPFTKSTNLLSLPGGDFARKRVIYRYSLNCITMFFM